jgi:hypothetical protein
MKKKTRTLLFFFCFALFLILTPIIILYCQGYRFDFSWEEGKARFVQTGGLYIKALPRTSEVYLDGKLKKKTSFLAGTALTKNLMPNSYYVEVAKEGYKRWAKELEIEEASVTEAKNIILFPKEFQFQILTKKVNDFWLSPDKEKIITLETSSNDSEKWSLKMFDIERNIKSYLVNEEDIHPEKAEFLKLSFEEEENQINLTVGLKEQIREISLDLSKSPPLIEEREKEKVPSYFLSYKKSNGKVYYLDNSGHLYQTENSFEPKMKLTEEPFPVKQETEYILDIFSGQFFLREENELYTLNKESKSFERIFDNVSGIKASFNEDKLAVFSEKEIKILFLRDINEQPSRKAGEEILITRLSENIENIFWLNPDYLIFTAGNTIKVSEIDNRDRINNYELGSFENPKMIWNDRNKKVYILSENNLYSSENQLIP